MAKRRKNRTHLKGGAASDPRAAEGVPKSFIIKHGQVGHSLAQLVRDMRKVMEPNTASRLRERSRNKLKDFLTMAPALGVTHLLAFTLTDLAPSFRIIRLSAGPTLSFRIERYSLAKDILGSSRRAKSMGSVEYLTPPLLVLASFPQPGPGTPPHLSLVVKTFQTLFPPLAPQSLSLSSCRRVVLVSYNAETGTIDFRHYLITVKPYGVSKRVQRILDGATTKGSSSSTKGLLDLGSEKDVADFLLRKRGEPGPSSDGYESAASTASSVAGDDADAISLADDYFGRNNKRGSKRAVRLDEIGPRMELRLIKIVEGTPGREGSVIYHEFVKKSKAEAAAQKADHAAKEKLRKQRKEEQDRNVKRKKAEAEAEAETKKGGKKKASEDDEVEEEDEDAEMEDAEDEEEVDDDDNWDDEEEISDDEEEDGGSDSDAEDSDSEAESEKPPPKKPKKSRR